MYKTLFLKDDRFEREIGVWAEDYFQENEWMNLNGIRSIRCQ